MPLFKSNQCKIPPVSEASASPTISSGFGDGSRSVTLPPYRSQASIRDGDRYSNSRNASSTAVSPDDDASSFRNRYKRSNGVGDKYSRGGADLDKDRQELFAGYKPNPKSQRLFEGHEEEQEDDIEGIKKQTRFLKQESVNTSRNALRLAREAEETARNTLLKLGDQSEKLAETERHLDIAKSHTTRAADKTDELKQLNRSIFRPVITFNKDAKRKAKEAKIQARYEEERVERETAAIDVRTTRNRLGAVGKNEEEELLGDGLSRRSKPAADRKRYQFDDSLPSDDDLEDQIDGNLDEISDATKRLKNLAMTMGQELDAQLDRIDRIDNKTLALDNKILINTERLKKIK